MICSKIANKITSVSKNSAKELQNKETEVDVEELPLERYIFPEERQQVIGELRLV